MATSVLKSECLETQSWHGRVQHSTSEIMIHHNCSSQHLICKRSGWKKYCVWKIEYGSLATVYVIISGSNWDKGSAEKSAWEPKNICSSYSASHILDQSIQLCNRYQKCHWLPAACPELLFSRESRKPCYHIYSSQATIFYFSDIVHFSARSLTYEMLRWTFFMDRDYICGIWNSPMSGLSLKTLRFEDRCSHLCHFRAIMDAQCYISTFSLDRWCFKWIILHGYDSAFYIVLWLLLLLYWVLWHVLTCGIMIWRS